MMPSSSVVDRRVRLAATLRARRARTRTLIWLTAVKGRVTPAPRIRGHTVYTELATGAKESESMSVKIRYTDEPLGDLEVVPDFLCRTPFATLSTGAFSTDARRIGARRLTRTLEGERR